MFKRSNPTTQRPKFCLTPAQIIEDITATLENENSCNKLYNCLDEKLEKTHELKKYEEFLKDTENLDENVNVLEALVNDLDYLQNEVCEQINELRNRNK